MDDVQLDTVKAQLRQAGLTHEVFVVVEIAEDLASRSEMNETLEELVESAPSAPDPTSFSPAWDS